MIEKTTIKEELKFPVSHRTTAQKVKFSMEDFFGK